MNLNSITRVEQYMCDALIASPLIPIGINVLRLADAIDNEGVVNQSNNMVVRFVGSSNNLTNKIPVMYTKTLNFEINISCQNYLTSSGHDLATSLLCGAEITLSGGVPSGAGLQVVEPFVCSSSRFEGLNKESQYQYTQSYSVVVEETLPFVALDPCVQRGDCSQIFPSANMDSSLPLGGVIDENTGDIYVPTNQSLGTGGIRWSNELESTGDWVFVCDPDEIFIPDPVNQPIYILSNNSFTPDGRLVVTVWDLQTRLPIREEFYVPNGRKLVRYAVELWRNTIDGTNNISKISPKARLDSTFYTGIVPGRFAVILGSHTVFYRDPLNPGPTSTTTITGGTLVGVRTDVSIRTMEGTYNFIPYSPVGRGWVLEGSYELAEINSLWKLGCLPCQYSDPPELC